MKRQGQRSSGTSRRKLETKPTEEKPSSGLHEYQNPSEGFDSDSSDDHSLHPKKKVKSGSYPCLLCGSVFPRRMFLHQHQRKAHTVKSVTGKLVVLRMKCSYPNCTATFTGNQPRWFHEAHVHSELRPVSCSQEGCDKTFKTKGALHAHFKRFHSDKRHQCNICYKEFAEIGKMRQHKVTHLSDVDREKFHCNQCDKIYLKKVSLKEHQIADHGQKEAVLYKCTAAGCGKSFPSNARRNAHIKLTHCSEKTVKCEVAGCDKMFKCRGDMNRHVIQYHPPEDSKPVICTVKGCYKTYKTQDGLKLHTKNIHLKERIVILQECAECGEKFEFRKQLSLHMKKCHEGNPCIFCGKRLANMNSLRAHVKRVHTGKKEFKCNSCKKVCLFEYELKEHVRREHEKIRLPCYFCPKSCSNRFNLFNHMNGVHLKEKLHKCPEPSCRFSSVSKAYCTIHYQSKHKTTKLMWVT